MTLVYMYTQEEHEVELGERLLPKIKAITYLGAILNAKWVSRHTADSKLCDQSTERESAQHGINGWMSPQ